MHTVVKVQRYVHMYRPSSDIHKTTLLWYVACTHCIRKTDPVTAVHGKITY